MIEVLTDVQRQQIVIDKEYTVNIRAEEVEKVVKKNGGSCARS